jgi:Cdc6-like AAA superfamily ATPase
MNDKTWNDFKILHSNLAGARDAFETSCESLFRKIYPNQHVSAVAVKQGDGGIDIFVGELGNEPITVIQCKFFLDTFEDSQKNQIRDSFSTAVNSDKYELKEWILCIPRVIDIDENSWWFKWKKKKIDEHTKSNSFIKLKNGNELIDLFKEQKLYNEVFKIDDAIKIDEIHKAVVPQQIASPKNGLPNVVLFNNYLKKREPYYLERQIDKEFINSLNLNNLWVFGNSGLGKTTLVNRNLIISSLEYCYCDLSPINITSSDNVLEEILCKIEEQFDIERDSKETNKIKNITQILCNKGGKIIIVIDELSVPDNSVLKEIANDLVKLVTHFCNVSDHEELKFVVSTISNPKQIVENKSKANQHFQYLNCDDWSNNIELLFTMLCESLSLDLTNHKPKILASSQNSPRILKSIFRKVIALGNLSGSSVEKAIKLVESELV